MTDNIQVNKTLYLVNIDRRDKENDKEVLISRIGKKYFYVSCRCQELKFDIKTRAHINTPYSPRYALYNSKQEYEYCIETERRRRAISDRLYQFLTKEEVNDIYNLLILRDK